MTTVSGTPSQIVVLTEGIQGRSGSSILGAPTLSTVSLTDLIPVVHGGAVYLATVAAVLAATAGGSAGQLNFSIAGNSGLASGVM